MLTFQDYSVIMPTVDFQTKVRLVQFMGMAPKATDPNYRTKIEKAYQKIQEDARRQQYKLKLKEAEECTE